MGVPNGGPNQGHISPSVLKCQNIKMIKWPNGQMAKWPNGQMAKWPNGAIEGVNVLKVIPRPTALRAVGKKLTFRYRIFDFKVIFDRNPVYFPTPPSLLPSRPPNLACTLYLS
jgi:hypothetical protein